VSNMDAAKDKTITAIEPQQRAKDRVNVFLDGEFAIGIHLEVAAALYLGVGQRISEERLRQISREESVRRAKDRAFLLLSYRARTEKEIRDRLQRAGYEGDVVDEVVSKLYELNYLDDKDFAEKFIRDRHVARPAGRKAIEWELQRKGVSGENLTQAIAGLDDESERELAVQAARSRLGRYAGLEAREARRKLAAFLQRRGFAWDTITSTLADIMPPTDAV
jgi:regulatory protein